jgi:tRNA nucleotidyltransferase (CCA-adding enzyme)
MKTILDRLAIIFPEDARTKVFLVGGAVRDLLSGCGVVDIDLAAALTAAEFSSLGFHLVTGKSTAPIWLRWDSDLGTLEATPLVNVEALDSDLHRRDFTVNAMAMTLAGEVIDPLAGRNDLQLKRLSPCSRTTFVNDPLRVIRAFRFASDGWCLTPECRELLRETGWDPGLASIPVERFSREMLKAFAMSEPDTFFRLLIEYDTGTAYLPELFRMPQVPAGPLIHHPEGDLLTHSIQVLQRVATVSNDPLTRFCALFHDIGKLATSPALYPRHHGHDRAGFGMALEFCRRLRLPVHYGMALSWVSRLHGTFNLWEQLRDATKLKVAEQSLKAGIVKVLPVVAAADKAGGNEPVEWRKALHIAGLSATELGLDLQALEQMQPSKRPEYILQKRVELFRSIRTVSF